MWDCYIILNIRCDINWNNQSHHISLKEISNMLCSKKIIPKKIKRLKTVFFGGVVFRKHWDLCLIWGGLVWLYVNWLFATEGSVQNDENARKEAGGGLKALPRQKPCIPYKISSKRKEIMLLCDQTSGVRNRIFFSIKTTTVLLMSLGAENWKNSARDFKKSRIRIFNTNKHRNTIALLHFRKWLEQFGFWGEQHNIYVFGKKMGCHVIL